VEPPARLQEYGAHLSVGAKACPTVIDWDGDGLDDLVLGNAAGQVLLARNAGTTAEPRFAPAEPFVAGDRPLWLMAGSPGTIQGPSEVKWGYVNPAAGTWRSPGHQPATAIVCGDALGYITMYLAADGAEGADHRRPTADEGKRGSGGGRRPAVVTRGRRLHVMRDGRWQPLATRWRCRPQLVDWGTGETVYVQVDEAGKIACYRILPDGPDAEDGTARVALLHHLRYESGAAIQLDSDLGGRVGRLKLAVADWDGDGRPDLLVGTPGSHPPGVNVFKKATVWLLRNTGASGASDAPVFGQPEALGLEAGEVSVFGGHSCVPAPCFLPASPAGPTGLGGRPLPDLLVGSENGRVYAFRRAYTAAEAQVDGVSTRLWRPHPSAAPKAEAGARLALPILPRSTERGATRDAVVYDAVRVHAGGVVGPDPAARGPSRGARHAAGALRRAPGRVLLHRRRIRRPLHI
jgi:hypothetical protein